MENCTCNSMKKYVEIYKKIKFFVLFFYKKTHKYYRGGVPQSRKFQRLKLYTSTTLTSGTKFDKINVGGVKLDDYYYDGIADRIFKSWQFSFI